MKTRFWKSRAGSALIIVLTMLILLTALVIALLFRVQTDLSLSKGYAGQANVKILAETALNLVIEQIRSGSSNVGQAWISQPGLIRTFDNTGNPVAAYKLYSSGTMTDTTGTFDPREDTKALTTDSWATQPSLYVDLNSPVMVTQTGTTTAIFPILDGNNMSSLAVGNKTLMTYSSNGAGVPDIEGFGVDPNDPNYTVNYSGSLTLSATNTPVPMPVKWIYVLKDGTLLSAAVNGSGKDVRVGTGASGLTPTVGNPIVGRMAFWTDDESSKINVNTAGEGTYWDTPVGISQPPVAFTGSAAYTPANAFDPDNTYESDLACRPPVENEFQHVPGHPATTCLSTVLGASIRSPLGLPTGTVTLTGTNRATFVQAIDALSPYLSDTNGSIGGTAVTDAGTTIASSAVTPNTYRLYANSDELFYGPTLSGSNSTRVVQTLAKTANIAPLVAESRFFLTANSSAPEVNLFGKPRVAIWPIPLTPSNRTTFDQQIALCSSVSTGTSTEAFYFTRSDPTSQTADWSARNAAIYTYLTGLADSAWPGYGGGSTGFEAKYPLDYNQIFTEIFDYIRCTNLCDPTPLATQYTQYSLVDDRTGTTTSPAQGQVVPISPGNGTRGMGRIATISDMALLILKDDTRVDQSQPETNTGTINTTLGPPIVELNYQGYITTGQHESTFLMPGTSRIEFSLIPQMFCPLPGTPPLANNLTFKFSNITISVTDSLGTTQNPFSLFTQPTLYEKGRMPVSGIWNNLLGGYIGAGAFTQSYGTSAPGASPTDSNFPVGQATVAGTPYPSIATTGPNASTSLTISGGAQVDVYSGSTSIQTFLFSFPSGGLVVPIPNLAQNGVQPAPVPPATTQTYPSYGSHGTVGTYTGGTPYTTLATPTARGSRATDAIAIYPFLNATVPSSVQSGNFDVVRTLELSGAGTDGDMRLVACTQAPPSSWFVVQNTGTNSTATSPVYEAYNFYNSSEEGHFNFPNTQLGNLIAGLPTTSSPRGVASGYPPLPENVSETASGAASGLGVVNYLGNAGDWDNGRGLVCDGPYMNKTDEGAIPSVLSNVKPQPANSNDFAGTPSSPYFGDSAYSWNYGMIPSTLFIPSRQIPSPVMFGSLPTGVLAVHPWQTLLFRPAKSYFPGKNNHPGAAVPNPVDGTASYPPYTTLPDHCLLDLFWMPTVQPYPISQPFATSGKINLNYQIAPFTYIERSTGMRAILKSVKITALNPTQKTPAASGTNMTAASNTTLFTTYKSGGTAGISGGGGIGVSLRRSIDLDKTVQEFEDLYFSNNKPFISESQICDVPLVPLANNTTSSSSSPYVNPSIPDGDSASAFDGYLATFWAANNLTGDNSLERPYVAIYPRITTKSNTYTVHVWVQTLKQVSGAAASADPAVFRNGVDQVTGEYRGSYVVERYLDPNTSGFYKKDGTPDTDSTPEQDSGSTLGPYKYRVLSTKQFAE